MRKLNDLFSLKGKVAFVPGGAGYLGNAICETLAELGANLYIASRDGEKCEKFAEKISKEFGVKAYGSSLDITNVDSIDGNIEKCISQFGRIDILVNDAWSGNKNTFDSISFEDWKYDVDVCLNGPFYTIKRIVPFLEKNTNGGVILNIASMYGHIAPDYRMYDGERYANPPSYGAAKAGIIQLTKYCASFLSQKKIRVNSISPGPFPFKSTQEENHEFIVRLSAHNILNRIGEPDDLKGAVALLCSDASKYMTGQNICVDGGWAVW